MFIVEVRNAKDDLFEAEKKLHEALRHINNAGLASPEETDSLNRRIMETILEVRSLTDTLGAM